METDDGLCPGVKLKSKKTHPCGGDIWRIEQMGMELTLKCEKCGRAVFLPRDKVRKNFKVVSS